MGDLVLALRQVPQPQQALRHLLLASEQLIQLQLQLLQGLALVHRRLLLLLHQPHRRLVQPNLHSVVLAPQQCQLQLLPLLGGFGATTAVAASTGTSSNLAFGTSSTAAPSLSFGAVSAAKSTAPPAFGATTATPAFGAVAPTANSAFGGFGTKTGGSLTLGTPIATVAAVAPTIGGVS